MLENQAKIRFKLYLITNRHLAAATGGLIATIEAALAGGADAGPPGTIAVQLREKDCETRELYELALASRAICMRFGAPLIVNERIDVAIASGADGIHLATTSFPIRDARELLGPSRLIGVSTHQVEEVSAAAHDGADFAVYGPVYDPLSKGPYGPAKGLRALTDAVKAASGMPLYALGGMNTARIGEICTLAGVLRPAGVASIGAIFAVTSPRAAVRELLCALNSL
jgi:thiamine-phosphate pyrophosphorylase